MSVLSDSELDAVAGGGLALGHYKHNSSTDNITIIKHSIITIGNTVAVDDSTASGGISGSVVIIGSGNTVN